MNERQFTAAVLEAAERFGWLRAHFHDSRREVVRRDGTRLYVGDRAAAGFPDLILCKPPVVLAIELKSEKGRVSPEQKGWLTALGESVDIRSFVFRPKDMVEIVRLLSDGRAEVTL